MKCWRVRYTEMYISQHCGHHEEKDMTVDISDIENIIARQNAWRQTQTINLIASENTPSEAVRRGPRSDFLGPSSPGAPHTAATGKRHYPGNHPIHQSHPPPPPPTPHHIP